MSGVDHQRLRELFDRAMQLDGEARAAFLESACAGDHALRARLEELTGAAADGTFLSAPTGEMGSQMRRQIAATAPLTERPGTRIGLYKLLQLIGEGGFGSVFLAEQEKPVRRRVALKIIKLGMDTRSVIARFEAERQALALMDHPHIARVLDAGATESGRPFFVMEYVVGDSITSFCDAHKLSVRERLELFGQVCQAVQHAHTKGVIHRDLKPGNILVSMSDGKPFAKVIDFGIAKATSQPLTDKTLFTEHRQLIGTPEYMSPEQAEGSPDIDTRTDVYALGVLLYELLTGATPFDAKRLRSAAWGEMQRIIKEEEPPVPSVRLRRDLTTLAEAAAARRIEPAKLDSQVRGELDWIVMKALEKERARRYEGASQLAADVQRHVMGEAVHAAPVSAWYRTRKFFRKHKGAVVSAEVALAALVVGTATTTWQMLRADAAVRKLTLQMDRAEAGVGKMMSILTGGATTGPMVSQDQSGNRLGKEDPLGYAIGFGTDLAESLKAERDTLARQQSLVRSTLERIVQAADSDPVAKAHGFVDGFPLSEKYKSLPESDREIATLAGVAEYTLRSAVEQADAAEWSAYTANIALAQASMQANNWPEARQRLEACPTSKRGWEWEILQRESSGTRWAKRGDFKRVALSSNGRLATLSNYQPPQIWDASSGEMLFALHTDDSANRIAFSPDGHLLATGSTTGSVDVWNEAGSRVASLQGHTDQINSVAFDSDGRTLVTSSVDGTIRVWDALKGTCRAVLGGNGKPVTCASISSDSAEIVATSTDGTISVWKAATGELVREIPTDANSLWSIAVAPGRSTAAVVSQKGELAIWDYSRGVKLETAQVAVSPFCNPQFIRSGEILAVGSPQGEVLLLDSRDLVERGMTSPRVSGVLGCLAADRDGRTMATIGLGEMDSLTNNLLSVVPSDGWGRAMSECFRESEDLDASLSAEALLSVVPEPIIEGRSLITPDGKRRIQIASDRTIRFFDHATAQEVAVFSTPDAVTRLRMRADGAILIISLADEDSPELFWDIRDPVERLKDRERERAEQPEADKYVDSLLASSRPTAELEGFLRVDESLTPLRRLVAWRALRDRLAEIERELNVRYAATVKLAEERQVKEKSEFAKLMESELAAAKDRSPRVMARLREMAEKWEYHAPQPTEAVQLSDAVRRADLLEAAGIMQRHLQPSEEAGYVAPNSVDLHRAYSLRLQHLGENDDATFEVEIEMLANDANYLGVPDARAQLDDAIARKERRTPVPDALLFRAWQFALDSNCDSCNIDRAEYYAKKIADSFRIAVEHNVKSIQIWEPVGDHIYGPDTLPPDEVDRVARALASDQGEVLRRRCIARTTRNLWLVASQGIPDWASAEPAFNLAKIRKQLAAECRQLLSVEPQSILGHQTLALLLYRASDLPAAQDAIERSISLSTRRADDPDTQEDESQPAPVARAIRALILMALGGDANIAAARIDAAAASAARKAFKGREAVLGFVEPAGLIDEAERETSKPAAAKP